jgi:uncharacterized protein DUF3883
MPNAWSRVEVESIVADYLEMLALELRGERFNKLARNRALEAETGRTHGSIERKHQNISAILLELGWRYVDGYKPLGNYQDMLRDVVVERIGNAPKLEKIAAKAADAPAHMPSVSDILACWEEPPERATKRPDRFSEVPRPPRAPRLGIDYLSREASNASLGVAGEKFALDFERARLIRAGHEALADRVEHVSATQGDGAGFDIRSFEVGGRDRFIEVKTTAGGKQMPFFVSRNELDVSRERRDSYHLYRVFRFRDEPGLFGLRGALDQACELDPVAFRATAA